MYKKYFKVSKTTYLSSLFLLTSSVLSTILASVLLSNILNTIIVKDYTKLIVYLCIEIAIWLIMLLANYGSEIFREKTIRNINIKIKDDITNHIANLSDEEYNSKSTDNYGALYVNDAELVENNIFNCHFKLIASYEMAIFSFIALFSFSYIIALFSILFFLVMYYVPKLFEKRSKDNAELLSSSKARYLKELNNQLNGYGVYSTYNLLSRFRVNINLSSRNLENDKYHYFKNLSFINLFLGLINVVSQLGNIIVCAILSMMGLISTGVILSVGNLSGIFYNSLLSISNLKMLIQSNEEILEKLSYERKNVQIKDKCSDINTIRINNIEFAYSDKQIFNGDNFLFEQGKKYLLAGSNGTGKSTLLKIIVCKLSNYKGNYLINEVDVQNLDLTSIKEKICYIEQNPYLFNDTVLYNITLGREIERNRLDEIIKQCQLEEFINEKGLDYIIDENAGNISGGQKQKIALARAFVRNCNFILFDEASANLDKKSHEEINKILLDDKDLTVIIVDHQMKEKDYPFFDKVYHL